MISKHSVYYGSVSRSCGAADSEMPLQHRASATLTGTFGIHQAVIVLLVSLLLSEIQIQDRYLGRLVVPSQYKPLVLLPLVAHNHLILRNHNRNHVSRMRDCQRAKARCCFLGLCLQVDATRGRQGVTELEDEIAKGRS